MTLLPVPRDIFEVRILAELQEIPSLNNTITGAVLFLLIKRNAAEFYNPIFFSNGSMILW